MNGLNLAVSPSTVQVNQAYSTTTIGGYSYYVVTDALARETKYKMGGYGGSVSGIRLPGSASDDVTVTYTGSVVTGITKAGATTTYARSDAGNTRTVTVTPPLGSATVYTFDIPSRRMTSFTVNDGVANRTTSYLYDGSGRLTRTTTPEGNYVQLTYDARGNVTERRAVGKSGSGVADVVTTAGYDATCSNPKKCNKPNWTRDAKNNQTDYTYDSTHGGVLTVTAPADAGGVRPQTRYGYSSLQAYYHNGSSIVASGQPTYRVTSVANCRTTASCTGGTDERKTAISYGPQTAGVGNNLLPVSGPSHVATARSLRLRHWNTMPPAMSLQSMARSRARRICRWRSTTWPVR